MPNENETEKSKFVPDTGGLFETTTPKLTRRDFIKLQWVKEELEQHKHTAKWIKLIKEVREKK